MYQAWFDPSVPFRIRVTLSPWSTTSVGPGFVSDVFVEPHPVPSVNRVNCGLPADAGVGARRHPEMPRTSPITRIRVAELSMLPSPSGGARGLQGDEALGPVVSRDSQERPGGRSAGDGTSLAARGRAALLNPCTPARQGVKSLAFGRACPPPPSSHRAGVLSPSSRGL